MFCAATLSQVDPVGHCLEALRNKNHSVLFNELIDKKTAVRVPRVEKYQEHHTISKAMLADASQSNLFQAVSTAF